MKRLSDLRIQFRPFLKLNSVFLLSMILLRVFELDFNCVHVYRSEPPNLTDKKYFDVATNPGEQNRFAFLSVKEWIA